MHPDKFLGRVRKSSAVALSAEERSERLNALGTVIAGKRKEAVDARKESGIEKVWLDCEEAYLGIDDMNRHEFNEARWAKPTSMAGPLTSNRVKNDDVRSSAYVRLTSRYVDNASAKLCEILLPVDDKAFSFSAMPDPDLIDQQGDLTPVMNPVTNHPVMQPAPSPQAGMPPVAAMPGATAEPSAPVPLTAADLAQQAIDKASESAEKAEKRVYDWMVESKYPAETRKIVNDAARIGAGILKGPFPDIKKSQAVTKSAHGVSLKAKKKVVPTLRWIDPWNFFPAEGCGENIHDGDDVLERDYLSKSKLKKLKEHNDYLPDQIDKVLEEGPGKIYAEDGNPNEKRQKNRFEIWYYTGTLTRDDFALAVADESHLQDVPQDQKEVYAVVTLVNDTVIRAVLNPLDSGSFPYNVMSWSRRPGHWAGVGVGEQINMPQRMVNASTRALLNNAGLSAGPQIIIDQLGVIPADGSWALTPNKIWYKTGDSNATDVREAFFAVLIPSVQAEMMAIIQYAMKLAEESSGIPLVTQGQSGPDNPETFGAAELQDNNAHTWLRSIGYAFDDQITEPVVIAMYEWLLLDPDVPDDEKAEYSINAHGSIAMVERAVQEQTLMGLLNASANPAFKVDPAKLFAEYLKAKRLDPRKIQYTKEEQDKMAQQPPPPPIQIAVEQAKGQNALQLQEAKAQAESQQSAQEMSHEQQMLQSGGASPHEAMAMSRIEEAKIHATTAQTIEASRANAEAARAQKELEIAQQNGQMDMQKMQLQIQLATMEYANKNNMQIRQVQAELAQSAMENQTKRQLAGAELQASSEQGDKSMAHEAIQNNEDRNVDIAKHVTQLNHDAIHTPSVVRDVVSTPNTP